MTEEFITEKQHLAAKTMRDAGIAVTAAEENNIEICDYDLGRYDEIGTAILIYVNTDRCCGKEMVLEGDSFAPSIIILRFRSTVIPAKKRPSAAERELSGCMWRESRQQTPVFRCRQIRRTPSPSGTRSG